MNFKDIKRKVLLFGDSIARGVVYDDESDRYRISPNAASHLVAEETGFEIVNRARMGMTSEGGLAHMQKDLESGLSGDAVVLEFGGNDSDFDWRAISEDPHGVHLPRTPLKKYESCMRRMIGMAKERGMQVLLCSLPPVLPEYYFDFVSRGVSAENILTWLGDKNKIYRFQERYSMIPAKLAREYNCRLLDLRAAFLDEWNPRPYFCRDGIHPSNKGQELIAGAILAAL